MVSTSLSDSAGSGFGFFFGGAVEAGSRSVSSRSESTSS